MLDELIAEIERLDREATRGPWFAEQCDTEHFEELAVVESSQFDAIEIYAPKEGFIDDPASVSQFIARSRSLLPLCAKLLRVFNRYAFVGKSDLQCSMIQLQLEQIIKESSHE